jgi:hypothetical protein
MAGVFGRIREQAMAQAQPQNFMVIPALRREAAIGQPPPIPLAPVSAPGLFQQQYGPVSKAPMGGPEAPQLPTASTQMAYWQGQQKPYVHAASACSSDLQNLAARLTEYTQNIASLSSVQATNNVNAVFQIIENCLSERYADSRRYGGMDYSHRRIYDMLKNLRDSIRDYFETVGQYNIAIEYFQPERGDGYFIVNLSLATEMNGRYGDMFKVDERGSTPLYRGGRRKKTYRRRKQIRKTRAKKLSRYGKHI